MNTLYVGNGPTVIVRAIGNVLVPDGPVLLIPSLTGTGPATLTWLPDGSPVEIFSGKGVPEVPYGSLGIVTTKDFGDVNFNLAALSAVPTKPDLLQASVSIPNGDPLTQQLNIQHK